MNGFLQQLSTRSLENTPLSVRPRALSRYEADSGPEDELSHETIAPAPPASVEQSLLRQPRTEPVAFPSNSNAGDPVVAPPAESSRDDLARRLDQLDHRISSIARPETPARSIVPLTPRSEPTAEPIHHSETHLYQQHNTQHLHPTRLIEKSTERIFTDSAPADAKRTRPAAEPMVAESAGKQASDAKPPTIEFIERQIEPIPRATTPQIVVHQYQDPPSVPSRNKGPNARPVPQIIVEKQPNESASHTVTVTIGRIEVRSPKQAAPTLPKPQRSKSRIMSLDDYVRRRAGGAS